MYWRTTNGREIPIRELTDEHLINTLNWLENTQRPLSEQQGRMFPELIKEGIRRGIPPQTYRRYRHRKLKDGDLSPRRGSRMRVIDTLSSVPLNDGRPTVRDWFEMKTYGYTRDLRFHYVPDTRQYEVTNFSVQSAVSAERMLSAIRALERIRDILGKPVITPTITGRMSNDSPPYQNIPMEKTLRAGDLWTGEMYRYVKGTKSTFTKIEPRGRLLRALTDSEYTVLEDERFGKRRMHFSRPSEYDGMELCMQLNMSNGHTHLVPCWSSLRVVKVS